MMLQTTYPFFQHKSKLIKYPKKEFACVPRCLPVTQNSSVYHMITAYVLGAIIFHQVQAKSELKNISGEILVSKPREQSFIWSQSSKFDTF